MIETKLSENEFTTEGKGLVYFDSFVEKLGKPMQTIDTDLLVANGEGIKFYDSIAEKLGYISKEKYESIISLLKEADLPVLIPENIDINKAIELMKKDKKGRLVFAFTEKDCNIRLDENKLRQFLK